MLIMARKSMKTKTFALLNFCGMFSLIYSEEILMFLSENDLMNI